MHLTASRDIARGAYCDRRCHDIVGWLIVGWSVVTFVNCG